MNQSPVLIMSNFYAIYPKELSKQVQEQKIQQLAVGSIEKPDESIENVSQAPIISKPESPVVLQTQSIDVQMEATITKPVDQIVSDGLGSALIDAIAPVQEEIKN
jgi:hypothetical protein